MPRPSRPSLPLYLLTTLLFSHSTYAQISMQEVQLIADFSGRCIRAYSTILPSCDSTMFRGIGGSGQCSQECFNEISSLIPIVLSACAGQTAEPDTVIGHFFTADADRFLCGFETAPAPAAGTTAAENTEAASTSTSTETTSSTSTTSTETSSSASTTETESESSTSTDATLTTTTLNTSTIPSAIETDSSTETPRPTPAGNDNDQIGITGGGSPFDIALPARGAASSWKVGNTSMMLGVLLGMMIML